MTRNLDRGHCMPLPYLVQQPGWNCRYEAYVRIVRASAIRQVVRDGVG